MCGEHDRLVDVTGEVKDDILRSTGVLLLLNDDPGRSNASAISLTAERA
jgi:hypothetical protein